MRPVCLHFWDPLALVYSTVVADTESTEKQMTDGCLKLLVVERHVGVRTALMQRLQTLPGVTACDAVDVGTAIEIIAERTPDAVLYEPKTTDGYQSTELQRLVQAGCPVVVLTSSLVDGEADEFRQAGAAAVLLKGTPFSFLLRTISAVLAAR
jgi:DNA-binding NarL/FixJ family response regulator